MSVPAQAARAWSSWSAKPVAPAHRTVRSRSSICLEQPSVGPHRHAYISLGPPTVTWCRRWFHRMWVRRCGASVPEASRSAEIWANGSDAGSTGQPSGQTNSDAIRRTQCAGPASVRIALGPLVTVVRRLNCGPDRASSAYLQVRTASSYPAGSVEELVRALVVTVTGSPVRRLAAFVSPGRKRSDPRLAGRTCSVVVPWEFGFVDRTHTESLVGFSDCDRMVDDAGVSRVIDRGSNETTVPPQEQVLWNAVHSTTKRRLWCKKKTWAAYSVLPHRGAYWNCNDGPCNQPSQLHLWN